MPALALLLLVALLLLPPGAAHAQPATRTKGPCPDCLSSLPAGTDPAPLLVVLHGDGEPAATVFDPWAPAASRRGVMVFAPACPRSEGCSAMSWWKWDGDPAWLRSQVDALAGQRALDRSRMWIVGWSGGGTYVGWHTQQLEGEYAALVIHGGGVPPARPTCSPTPAGIYFLGGDRNPLHEHAERLHDYYRATCPHPDLTWTVLAGVDHQGERGALPRYREAILDWLSTHRRTPVNPGSPDGGDPPTPPAAESSTATQPPPAPSGLHAAPPPSASCHCETAGSRSTTVWPGALALVAAIAVRVRARASRRR